MQLGDLERYAGPAGRPLYNVRKAKLHLPRMSDAFLATVDTTFASQLSQVDVSDQLASLERHG